MRAIRVKGECMPALLKGVCVNDDVSVEITRCIVILECAPVEESYRISRVKGGVRASRHLLMDDSKTMRLF